KMSAPTRSVQHMQTDAEQVFRRQLDQQEKLITIMQPSGNSISEDRIISLEKRVREMEALSTGLINEMLDLKSNFRMMSREAGERSRQHPEPVSIIRDLASPAEADPSTGMSVSDPSGNGMVFRPQDTRQPGIPAVTAEASMASIMQPDGTMKFEIRRGPASPMESSAGYGPKRMAHLPKKNRTL
ncbi:MAG TPA: hypothetical protein VFG36_05495, partial [Methanoregula sp.]|nr:hypothetical protein [Methanoregula sp.]